MPGRAFYQRASLYVCRAEEQCPWRTAFGPELESVEDNYPKTKNIVMITVPQCTLSPICVHFHCVSRIQLMSKKLTLKIHSKQVTAPKIVKPSPETSER